MCSEILRKRSLGQITTYSRLTLSWTVVQHKSTSSTMIKENQNSTRHFLQLTLLQDFKFWSLKMLVNRANTPYCTE